MHLRRRGRSVMFGILGLVYAAGACACGGGLGPLVTADRGAAYRDARRATAAYTPRPEAGCAAVWVSASKLFTAGHCAEADEGLGTVTTAGGVTVGVVVLAVHPRIDLAVLEAVGRLPEHGTADVGETPAAGDHVVAVGMPLGLGWTLTDGLVTGTHVHDGAPWLQASADVIFGNSGGPLFDDSGDLVGICSHGGAIPFAAHLGFWVHPGFLRVAHRTYVAGR